jgi:hypothetical protein
MSILPTSKNLGVQQIRNYYYLDTPSLPNVGTSSSKAYIESENFWYESNSSTDYTWKKVEQFVVGNVTWTDGVITFFNSKQSFKVADEQDVVKKSGDTMTGNLIISRNTASIIECQNLNMDYTSTEKPSSNTYCGGMTFYDKNHKALGVFRNRINTGGIVQTQMSATRSVNGTDYTASLIVGVDANGDQLCTFPMCATKATTTSSASTAKVAVVVQNYVNGTSWYRVWSDGWIEQGGVIKFSNDSANTVTFLKKFSNTNYSLVFGVTTPNNNGVSYQNLGARSKSATGFTAWANQTYITIGKDWYACGY